MNYKISENNSLYEVIETTTGQKVKAFMLMTEAKKFMRHLNLGGGFDGWTPTFLLKNISNNDLKA